MDSQIYGALGILFFIFNLIPPAAVNAAAQISSNSVLVALLDSHYTELSELIEKALLETTRSGLQTVPTRTEESEIAAKPAPVSRHPVPGRVGGMARGSDSGSGHYETLCVDENDNRLELTGRKSGEKVVGGLSKVTRPDDVIRHDGLIHGIEQLLVPRLVQEEFNRRRSLTSISAVMPEGAPDMDNPIRKKKPAAPVPAGSPPALPISSAMAPGPSLAPAPAPGPGGARRHFDGESQVKDFIQTLVHYGGYNELADILVNLTALATEMGKLVSEGYVLTVLAPNDEAMAKLTTEQLSDPGAPERIIYYHLIPEYQTEESMYNSVRRFGKVQYDTLRLPHKVVAEEADGSVKFGSGEESGYLFDPDIYTDGRISVQGIDGVLFPVEQVAEKPAGKDAPPAPEKLVVKQNRGKLLEVACSILGAFGQHSESTRCY
ncbi:hypothetical protein SSX86_009164 [Deinandra increscens subsp. villosa]|uniref:FAS1 domain-containing protein n=1 Tax=Deinandra increscens subsp. villosa TaxID=3103831 RepID=A0AAP0DKI1_9ASTR